MQESKKTGTQDSVPFDPRDAEVTDLPIKTVGFMPNDVQEEVEAKALAGIRRAKTKRGVAKAFNWYRGVLSYYEEEIHADNPVMEYRTQRLRELGK